MTKFIDSEGFFDATGQKLLTTTTPTVVNGDLARALWFGMSDQRQIDCLYWGPGFDVFGGADNHFGRADTETEFYVCTLAPAFCDRLGFDIYAAGEGNVTFDSYVVPVQTNGQILAHIQGSKNTNLLTVTNTTGVGSPQPVRIPVTKDAGVDLRVIRVHFLRGSQTIT